MQIANTNPMTGMTNTAAAQAGVRNAGTRSAGTKSAGTANTGVDFCGQVMKCVSAGGQKVMLNSDALMSYASPQRIIAYAARQTEELIFFAQLPEK